MGSRLNINPFEKLDQYIQRIAPGTKRVDPYEVLKGKTLICGIGRVHVTDGGYTLRENALSRAILDYAAICAFQPSAYPRRIKSHEALQKEAERFVTYAKTLAADKDRTGPTLLTDNKIYA